MTRYAKTMSQTLAEMRMNDPKLNKIFDKLKPKMTVQIKKSSTIKQDKDFGTYLVVSKNTLRNGTEKITLKNRANPTGVKSFLYRRDGKVTFAIGDMAASIDDIKENLEEGYEKEVLNVLSDAGIDGYFRNGKLYVDKRDAKDAKAALEDADNIIKLPKMVKEEVEDLDEASARADAMRAMGRGKKVDPADVDEPKASAIDKASADKNMVMQMRKVMDVKGNATIEFGDGKKEKVDPKIVKMMLTAHDKIQKPRDKEKFLAMISKSKRDMLNVAKKLATLKMELNKDDVETIKNVVKGLKGAVKAHTSQAKDLEKAIKEALDLDEGFSPKEIKMAIGIASDPRYKGGNYTGAFKAIEKIKKGLGSHPQVAAVLKKQNENLGEGKKFSNDMIDKLKKAYEPMKGKKINPTPLMKIFDKIDSNKDGLEQLYKADIPFVSMMAMSRLMLKHDYKADDINKLGKIRREDFVLDEMSYKPGSFKDTRPQEKTAKALDGLIKDGGLDKKDFQKARQLYVQASDAGSREKLKKFIFNLDTSPAEALMDMIGRNDPDTFIKMYPKSKKGERLTSISYAHRNVKAEEKESLDTIVQKQVLYHKTFSDAMQHAYDYAKKKLGITVDPKEIDNKVATGPKKPSEGKTNIYRLKGKGGNLQIQVYNKGGRKPFELTMYKEGTDPLVSLYAHQITLNAIKEK